MIATVIWVFVAWNAAKIVVNFFYWTKGTPGERNVALFQGIESAMLIGLLLGVLNHV